MTLHEFLTLVDHHSFIIFYYGFSMLFSVLLGLLFLHKMGHPKVWNYFFSFLLYMMSVLGMFSLIMAFYQWITSALVTSAVVILIPFVTMVIGLVLIYNRVDITLLTGFGNGRIFFAVLFFILITGFWLDQAGWVSFSTWPVYLVLLFFIGMTLVVRKVSMIQWDKNK
ncbi:hypothetical protein KUV50_14955 [Membranicola marinus]|uniref:Uncharacterized protein n=1 Tax=Membranihabitans marinus TaxID=1227546 RepID=A0A953HX78_9BACT|nr:hypothetical protein [Membranihabitans marinus]MBY5959448.1 hypothetical protein [Membranihabitans marinus]